MLAKACLACLVTGLVHVSEQMEGIRVNIATMRSWLRGHRACYDTSRRWFLLRMRLTPVSSPAAGASTEPSTPPASKPESEPWHLSRRMVSRASQVRSASAADWPISGRPDPVAAPPGPPTTRPPRTRHARPDQTRPRPAASPKRPPANGVPTAPDTPVQPQTRPTGARRRAASGRQSRMHLR